MKKKKTAKLPKLFTKKYSEKKLKNRVLKKIYIPADKKLVQSLVVAGKDKKGRKVYSFDTQKPVPSATLKKLKIIAKDLKKQKGRFNVVHILISITCLVILFSGIALFRNVLARKLITGAMENTFGAVCDIERIDFDILDTRFVIENLEQANRSKPMTNLFEAGRFELYFNLLELTRGKLVSENVEITGIRAGTERTVPGTLSPLKERKYRRKREKEEKKSGPVRKALSAQIEKIKNEVSVDSGITAVQNQLDPAVILEREKEKLQAPAVLQELSATVPGLADSWRENSAKAEAQIAATQDAAQKIAAIKVDEIKTIEEGHRVLKTLNSAKKTIDENVSMITTYSARLDADRKTVMTLSQKTQDAIAADSRHLYSLAQSVSSFNMDRGKGLIAQVLETFAISTFGEYYPWLDRGLSLLQGNQSGKKSEKNQTFKAKKSVIDRLPGRTFVFGPDSLPGVVFKNISLSADDDDASLHGEGLIRHLSNNADQLDKPALVTLGTVHGTMRESVEAVVDLRTDARTVLDSDITARGYPVSLDSSGIRGVPSITGTLSANGQLLVMQDRSVSVDTTMRIDSARLTIDPFEPDFVYSAYRQVLAGMRTIDCTVKIDISSSGDFDTSVSTNADTMLYRSIQQQLDRQVDRIKGQFEQEIDAYIQDQKQQHAGNMKLFTTAQDRFKKAENEIQSRENSPERKQEAVEKRIRELVNKNTAPLLKDAEKNLKKLF